MDGTRKPRRQRAVQLTNHGLELLQARLQEERRALPQGSRLTREARADLMGVSTATAERILSRQGNDRNVLIEVFSNLELDWRDDYCQYVTPQPRTEPLPPVERNRAEDPSRSGNRRFAVLPVIAAVPLLLLVGAHFRNVASEANILAIRNEAVHALSKGREAYTRSDYARANASVKKAMSQAKDISAADIAAEALTLQGDVLAAQGHLERALAKYREALPLWSTFDKTHGKGTLLEIMAVTEARLGMLDQARAHFLEGYEIVQSLGPTHIHIGSLRGLGSLAAVQGDRETAHKWYAKADSALDERSDEAMRTDLRALRALLLRDDGRFEDSVIELEACLKFWQQQKHPRWQATTWRQKASVLMLAGDEDRAKHCVSKAIDLYERVGDTLGAAECRRILDEGADYIRSQAGKIEDYF
ncbi:MAG: hypothetical protein IT363_15710 [Methanoregulaceae archaeon]|nr:hypothetical protein [Methanoregulaceae archaeon]